MNSGIAPSRVTAVAPALSPSPAGPLRPVSARSYQSTAKTAVRAPTNTDEEEEILLELIEECERVSTK